MSTKTYTIIGMEFQLEDSIAAARSVADINSNYDSLIKANPDMDETTAMLSILLRAGMSRYCIPKGTPSTNIELKVIRWAFQISTTEMGKVALQDVEQDLNERYAKLSMAYPDKTFDELSRLILFQLYYPSWETIERCIDVAESRDVKQTEIIGFLKGTFNIALDVLEGLVQNGIELSDKDVVIHLMHLRKAINLLPTDRVHCMDAPDVGKEFREQEFRFHKLLSTPRQNAEDSFAADWVIGKLDYLQSQFEKLEQRREQLADLELMREEILEITDTAEMVDERINAVSSGIENQESKINEAVNANLCEYAQVCRNLLRSGSNKICLKLLDATSSIAESFMSEGMFKEAQEMLKIAVMALEKENPMIQQREERLSVTRRSLETAENPFGK